MNMFKVCMRSFPSKVESTYTQVVLAKRSNDSVRAIILLFILQQRFKVKGCTLRNRYMSTFSLLGITLSDILHDASI